MSTNKLNQLRNLFDAIPSENQWDWIIANREKVNGFFLDNDATHIIFSGDPMDDPKYSTYVKYFIGNDDGVFMLLDALGFNVEGV